MDIVGKILEQLHVGKSARLVYSDLVEHGASPARLIAMRLSMTRPSVYDQLNELMSRGLVVERGSDGKTLFVLRDIADLGRFLEKEREHIESLEKEFGDARETLAHQTRSVEPKIRFVSGREGIVGSMHDMLWDDSECLKVVWPYREMVKTLGKESLVDFNKKRIRQRVRLQSIWSSGEANLKTHMYSGEDEGVERRFAPHGFSPRMGYTIYGDKVLFVSSSAEVFGFTVQSRDFADLMRAQFDMLWDLSVGKKKKK